MEDDIDIDENDDEDENGKEIDNNRIKLSS